LARRKQKKEEADQAFRMCLEKENGQSGIGGVDVSNSTVRRRAIFSYLVT